MFCLKRSSDRLKRIGVCTLMTLLLPIQAIAGQLVVTHKQEITSTSLTSLGSADWMHFGRTDATSINRRALANPLLTYAPLNSAPKGFTSSPTTRSTLSWTNGTPITTESGTAAGFYFNVTGAGYSLTAPAGTGLRTLVLFTGGFNTSGTLQFSLSDSSATPVTLNLSGATAYSHTVTVQFAADSEARTLNISHSRTGSTGNIILQGVALTEPVVNQPPVLTNPGNKTVQIPGTLSFTVNATDQDGPSPLALSISASSPALPQGVFTDQGGGQGQFLWTPALAHVGTYSVTFRAAEPGGTGLHDEETITLTVNPAGGGQLSATNPSTAPFSNNLTSEGTLDWMHFGLTAATSINRKNSGQPLLGFTKLTTDPLRFSSNPATRSTHAWSDGTPQTSEPGFAGGIYFRYQNSGYVISAPADTDTRTLKMHVGGYNSQSEIVISLSDGSAPSQTFQMSSAGVYQHLLTVTYSAATAGQTLSITHRQTSVSSGNVSLQAVSLAGAAPNQAPNLVSPGNRSVTANHALNFQVNATDSDGPAPLALDISSSSPPLPAGVFTDNGNGTGTFDWTPANLHAGTWNVTFRARENGGSGQADTESITITVSTNQPPQLANPGNKTINAGSPLTFDVSATDPDGQGPLLLDISSSNPALPAGVFIDHQNGTGTFSWTPGNQHVAVHTVTFRARESGSNGQSDEETISLTVNPTDTNGLLTASAPSVVPFTNNLTSQGTLDWMHFGLTTSSSINRKAGVAAALVYSVLAGTPQRFTGSASTRPSHTWTDGEPAVSGGPFPGGVYVASPTAGSASYRITAPADTSERTLRVHLGGYNSAATLSVSLSDGSAAPFTTTLSGTGVYAHEAIVNYRAASAGQTVQLTLTSTSSTGNIVLQAATLTGPAVSIIPFSDNFADGNMDGWTVVNESTLLGNWFVTGGELQQQAKVETASARIGTYQLGSYAWLAAGSALSNFRLSVAATHVPAPGRLGEDIGVMFRYQNANNYYRLSMNSRHGYTRLEKRFNGTFSTLAVNSRGYRPAVTQLITIQAVASTIFVWINGDPVFAVEDASLSTGTVALYSKHFTRFDDVAIVEPSTTPTVILAKPLAFTTSDAASLSADALALNLPAGHKVRFSLDGGSAIVDSAPPFSAIWNNPGAGNHSVTATLLNASDQPLSGSDATDTNTVIGVAGETIVAIGDSITNGSGDNYLSDNISGLQRLIGFQGPQTRMIDTLDATRVNTPTLVINEGQGGDDSIDASQTRIASIRERHPGLDRVIVGLGTNDALTPIPSGAGCSGAACADTYKSYMQTLVDKIRFADYPGSSVPTGVIVHVALPPPIFTGGADPYNHATNVLLRQYAAVIQGELTGISAGPDLFAFFMPGQAVSTHRQYLFSDTLHPNGLGYEIIGTLWHNALEPGNPLALPFFPTDVTSSVVSNLPQADLVEVGDTFRVNGVDTVTSIPSGLAGGRWILTNNDSSNTSSNYLSFKVDRSVTVHVAYDGGSTSRPAWMNGFTATGQTLQTTDPNGPQMTLYSRVYSANSTVTLGGNNASGASGANTNYVAIIVEN